MRGSSAITNCQAPAEPRRTPAKDKLMRHMPSFIICPPFMSIDNAKEMPDWLPKSSIFFCQKWVFRKNGKKKCGSILYFGTRYSLPNLSFLRHSQIIFIRRGFSLGSGDSTGDCFKSRLRRRLASLKRLFTTGSAIKRIPRFNSSPTIIKLLGYDPFSHPESVPRRLIVYRQLLGLSQSAL